jgi:hypothetical protein
MLRRERIAERVIIRGGADEDHPLALDALVHFPMIPCHRNLFANQKPHRREQGEKRHHRTTGDIQLKKICTPRNDRRQNE